MTANRYWPLIVLMIILIVLGFGLTQDPNTLPSALKEKPAPKFNLPELMTESMIDNRIFKGHPTLVSIWASWCMPCRVEHPILAKIKIENPRLKLFGINYKDEPADAKRFLSTLGNPYDWVVSDKHGSVGLDWGVYGTPETFLLDDSGRVIYRHAGALRDDIWAREFKPLLNKYA